MNKGDATVKCISFKGFPSLRRQILQLVLNLVRSMLVGGLFSFSCKRILLSIFVKGKSRHTLQSQIYSPGLLSCLSLYFLSLILAQVL